MKFFSPILILLVVAALFVQSTSFVMAKSVAGSSASLTRADDFVADERVEILYNYLDKYNSPLRENAETFVRTADKYNLDWRLLAAISGVESTFAKQLPYNSHNAWGWGIYGDNMIRFRSYDEAIETISQSLREKYIDKWGAQDVYQIGRFYASSPTWAQRVTYFMEKINPAAKVDRVNKLPITI